MAKNLRVWLIFLLFSVILVPIVVFLGGLLLAGPYEGNGGVFGLMGVIYRDALTGHASALLLLSSPLLLVGGWLAAFWLRRNIIRRQTAPGDSEAHA